MDVIISADGLAMLRDHSNFRGFRVVVSAEADLSVIAAANPALIRGVSDHDHLWLSVGGVAGLGPDGDWADGYNSMIAYAATKGWLRADGAEVAAHVERE